MNIIKLLLIFGISISIIIEPTFSKDTKTDDNKETEEEVNEEEEDGKEEGGEGWKKDYDTSTLSCVLFRGSTGGQPVCAILGKAYSVQAQGVCDSSFVCNCETTESSNLDTLWKSKFAVTKQSRELFEYIKSDPLNASKALQVLNLFPRTEKESKAELLGAFSTLPKAQKTKMEKLRPKNNIPANQFIKNGEIDKKAIKQFVKDNFESAVDKVSDDLLQVDYQHNLKIFVQANFPAVSQKLIRAIYQVDNTELTTLFESARGEKVISKDTWEYTVPDEIAAAVIDKALDYIKTTPKSFASVLSIYKLLTPQVVRSAIRIPVYISFSKDWKDDKYKPKYSISYNRQSFITNLRWIVGEVDIKIKQSANGPVSQTWIFEKVQIDLSVENDGKYVQKWDFGNNFVYEESKNDDNQVTSSWSNGKSKPRLLAQYKTYIIDWCRENYSLYQLYRCVIFM